MHCFPTWIVRELKWRSKDLLLAWFNSGINLDPVIGCWIVILSRPCNSCTSRLVVGFDWITNENKNSITNYLGLIFMRGNPNYILWTTRKLNDRNENLLSAMGREVRWIDEPVDPFHCQVEGICWKWCYFSSLFGRHTFGITDFVSSFLIVSIWSVNQKGDVHRFEFSWWWNNFLAFTIVIYFQIVQVRQCCHLKRLLCDSMLLS